MPDQTPVVEDTTPLSEETEQLSEETIEETTDETTETVESLKEQLAAESEKTEKALEEKEKAEEEAKTWKGRVKEENPPKEKKKEESSDDYADWRIDNVNRIKLVKEEYDKELSELQESGAKLTNSLRDKALSLAEGTVGVKKEEKTEPIPEGTTDRGGDKEPQMTEHDVAFEVKPEIKKKYANMEAEWSA